MGWMIIKAIINTTTLFIQPKKCHTEEKNIKDDNGWGHMLQKPVQIPNNKEGKRKTLFTIITPLKPEYTGHKHTGQMHPDERVYTGAKKIVSKHYHIRIFEHEYGVMADAGRGIDLVPSSMTYYTPVY